MTDKPHSKPRSQGLPAVLSVGVTGHRAARLADCDLAALGAAIAATLAQLEQAAPTRAWRAISALADGADSIVVELALQRGWLITSILPFSRAEYAADFASPDSLAVYERLLRASHTIAEPRATNASDAPAAYERAGRTVLGQADILLAIWDGAPAQGRGGTGQIVTEAVACGTPVIQIDPWLPAATTMLWTGLGKSDPDAGTVQRHSLDALPGTIRQLLSQSPRQVRLKGGS